MSGELEHAFRLLAETALEPPRPNDLRARDPFFIEAVRPLFDFVYDRYFRCITELAAEVPPGPALLVANHNGIYGMPDMFCHMAAFWRRYGTERPAYGLAHELAFRTPMLGSWINRFGALYASQENAKRALEAGAALLVFPGGELEACRPFRRRHRIDFGGRRGFVRTALRHRVPIVPIVSTGGHETLHVLSDGRWLARALRFKEMFRVEALPFGFALPWGLWFGPLPHLPAPVRIRTRFLEPIHFDHPPGAEDDERLIDEIYRRVVATMQRALDELASRRRP